MTFACCLSGRRYSGAQLGPALGTAGSDDLAAVLGSHSLQKAVHAAALTLLGLKSSFHLVFPPMSSPRFGGRFISVMSAPRILGMTLQHKSIAEKPLVCQHFLKRFFALQGRFSAWPHRRRAILPYYRNNIYNSILEL